MKVTSVGTTLLAVIWTVSQQGVDGNNHHENMVERIGSAMPSRSIFQLRRRNVESFPNLEDLGSSPATPLKVCQGDCDVDSDCEDELVCHQREWPGHSVPGCSGSSNDLSSRTDFCIREIPSTTAATTGSATTANLGKGIRSDYGGTPSDDRFPLQVCEGDCDIDDDCDEGLVCYQRDEMGQSVPGCMVGGSSLNSRTDYCVDDSSPLSGIRKDYGGTPSDDKFPLQVCEGDCDIDDDCDEGLICYQRDEMGQSVPGCMGGGSSLNSRTDYCIEDPTATTTAATTTNAATTAATTVTVMTTPTVPVMLPIDSPALTLTVPQVQAGIDVYNRLQSSQIQVSQNLVDEINKRTASYSLYRQLAFIAQTVWESAGYFFTEELAATTGNNATKESYQDCDWNTPGFQLPDNGKFYFGRGYMQLSWCANYRAYGAARAGREGYDEIDGPDFFYDNPELVATTYAMDSAAWFFEANVPDNTGQFGATTNSINGNIECSDTSDGIVPKKRYDIFVGLAEIVGLVGYSAEGCIAATPEPTSGPSTELSITSPAQTLKVENVQTGIDVFNTLQGGTVQVEQALVDDINARTASFSVYRQLALVAHTIWQSAAFVFTEELAATTGNNATKAFYQDCDWNTPGFQLPDNDNFYFGRGYMQLSWCANYRAYGAGRAGQEGYDEIDGPDFFYDNPDLVATTYAMDSAAWFFAANVPDNAGNFGATTKSVNGGECAEGSDGVSQQKRYDIFVALAESVGLPSSEYSNDGCLVTDADRKI